MAGGISLTDLVEQGRHDDHVHASSGHPHATALEWLGLAVGELPYLVHAARTVDDLNWRSHARNAVAVNVNLVDALGQHLATAAALVHSALLAHLAAHPECGDPATVIGDVDFLSRTLVEDHPPLSRRADLLLGGYVTAVAAAVQGSGRLGEARVDEANGDEGRARAAFASVVCDALTRSLATLLGHARLNERDRDVRPGPGRLSAGSG